MFTSLKQRIIIGVYVFLVLSIPVGAFLASKEQNVTSKAAGIDQPTPTLSPSKTATASAKTQLLEQSLKESTAISVTPVPTLDESLPTTANSFGPTMSFKASLEGRPAGNEASKLFIGIIEGDLTANPKFVLSFSIDLPANGIYSNLSLAGLTVGNKYTAILKGPAQLAAAVSFVVAPNITSLNEGTVINLTSGDLNEDNVVNSSDYSIVLKAFGATPSSSNWDDNADFNKDGLINVYDLGIVSKNIDTTGTTGAWSSPIPTPASSTASASIESNPPPMGGPATQSNGYWMWIPK